MPDAPLISVIVPARNAAATLPRTLECLLGQSERNWQACIVDDASTDGTAAVISGYLARDTRFSTIRGAGAGVGQARNLGIFAARGKWLHFLDADDWNHPAFFTTMLAALRNAPDAVAAYCSYCRVMPGGLITDAYRMPNLADDPFEDFARGCPVAIHAVLVEREAVQRLGGFDPDLRICEDWDLWQRVARVPRRWVLVDEALAYYRTEGVTLSRNAAGLLANSRIILNRGFGGDERPNAVPDLRSHPPSVARGSRSQAFAYNALWTAAMACGSGGSGQAGADMLQPFTNAGLEAHAIAGVIFAGLMVGSRSLTHQLAERWPDYGERLTALIAWVGALWNDPGAARAIQYRLEEMILYSEPSSQPRRLSLTLSVRVDVRDPPETVLPGGIDRIFVNFADGGILTRRISVAAHGDYGRRQWLETARSFFAVGYRAWRRTHADADWLLLRRLAGQLRRQPGLALRRWQLRHAWRELLNGVIAELAAASDPPESHAARLAVIINRAAIAARETAVAPAAPVAVICEDSIDPTDRQGHFERLFETADPWRYHSAYEQQKYQRQLAMLPAGPIGRALELGCAEGHFTALLAARVGHLLAADISATALARAAARCADLPNIEYRRLDFSADPIPGGMDLIICSEVLYYLADVAELRNIAAAMGAALRPGGHLVMAHAHAVKDDMARTGFDWDSVYGVAVINRAFASLSGLALERSIDTELYRIDRFRRCVEGDPVAPPVIETAPVAAPEAEVARSVVWGGAKLLRAEARRLEQRARLPVLLYHSVSAEGPEALARYRVTPDLFRAQLRWLRANGFHGIGSEQLLTQIRSGAPFAGRPILITFDDGLQDFADQAWPILRAHDFNAEMFVVTDRVGQTATWDQDKGPPAPLMDAATIARLAGDGALFGSHGATHRPLDGLSAEALAEELAGSRAKLAQWLGRPPVSFAAPFSITDSRLAGLVAQCGYGIGFGGEKGPARLDMYPLDLPRMEVAGDQTLEAFIAMVEAAL